LQRVVEFMTAHLFTAFGGVAQLSVASRSTPFATSLRFSCVMQHRTSCGLAQDVGCRGSAWVHARFATRGYGELCVAELRSASRREVTARFATRASRFLTRASRSPALSMCLQSRADTLLRLLRSAGSAPRFAGLSAATRRSRRLRLHRGRWRRRNRRRGAPWPRSSSRASSPCRRVRCGRRAW
jgi:hypothetical protein